MQEEVNEKTVSLCITGGKVTVRLLKQAMMRFLSAMEKEKAERSRKQQQTKGPPDKEYHGKQSMKKLAHSRTYSFPILRSRIIISRLLRKWRRNMALILA